MTSSKIDLLSSSLNHTVHYTVAHIVSNDKFYFMIDFFSEKMGCCFAEKDSDYSTKWDAKVKRSCTGMVTCF